MPNLPELRKASYRESYYRYSVVDEQNKVVIYTDTLEEAKEKIRERWPELDMSEVDYFTSKNKFRVRLEDMVQRVTVVEHFEWMATNDDMEPTIAWGVWENWNWHKDTYPLPLFKVEDSRKGYDPIF